MAAYMLVICVLILGFCPELSAHNPIQPLPPANPTSIGIFAGLDDQMNDYEIAADSLLPEGLLEENVNSIDFYYGASLKLPVNKFYSTINHSVLFSLSYHNSEFKFVKSAEGTGVSGDPLDEEERVTGEYRGEVSHKFLEFSSSWFLSGWDHSYWLSLGVGMQYRFSVERAEEIQVSSGLEAQNPSGDSRRLANSARYSINQRGDMAQFLDDQFEVAPWTASLTAGLGYMFAAGRFEFGPSVVLYYSLSNLDGKHANWRPFSLRAGLNMAICIDCSSWPERPPYYDYSHQHDH